VKLAWTTDPHLDWLDASARAQYYDSLAATKADSLLIGGDIGNAESVTVYLAELERALQRPIYFVLGNHDFYGGSIVSTRRAVAQLAASSQWLRYLSVSDPVALSSSCALMGHDGWADARLGEFFLSPVVLNDYVLIEELKLRKWRLQTKLNALGDEAADHLERSARASLATHSHVLVLTHVPPFREACWHEGQISNDLYLPHFASRAAGERLASLMAAHSHASMTVLCGHTHSSGYAQPLPNLEVYTAGSEYGHPAVARLWDV
jgi:3',5'-cyclic-AMP phosphodiesterase